VWQAGDRQTAESSYILIGWLNRLFPFCVNYGGNGRAGGGRYAPSPRLSAASSVAFNSIAG
jgi:hypothetical protein